MEAKKFLFKSSNILSVAILLAGLTTFGAGVYTSDTNAKDMAKQTKINNHRVALMQDTLAKEKLKYDKQIKLMQNQLHTLSQQNKTLKNSNRALKKKVATFKTRNESPLRMTTKPKPKPQHRQVNVVATAYTNSCSGCTGITSTGVNIKNTIYHNGVRVIATDPSIIPTHSLVRIETSSGQSFLAVAEDKGGAIHGGIIDVLVSSYDDAINFGRQTATITILREGA